MNAATTGVGVAQAQHTLREVNDDAAAPASAGELGLKPKLLGQKAQLHSPSSSACPRALSSPRSRTKRKGRPTPKYLVHGRVGHVDGTQQALVHRNQGLPKDGQLPGWAGIPRGNKGAYLD